MDKDFATKIEESLHHPSAKEADALGLHLLRINVRGAQHTPVIEIIIDGSRDVSIEDCSTISRNVNAAIELGSLVKGNFRLDVMSPGLEEPLTYEWQLKKYLNRLVEAHYTDGEETHTVHGYLREFSELGLSIEPFDHAKRRKPRSISPSEIPASKDEQVYEKSVELVVLDRKTVTKLVAVAVFS